MGVQVVKFTGGAFRRRLKQVKVSLGVLLFDRKMDSYPLTVLTLDFSGVVDGRAYTLLTREFAKKKANIHNSVIFLPNQRRDRELHSEHWQFVGSLLRLWDMVGTHRLLHAICTS